MDTLAGATRRIAVEARVRKPSTTLAAALGAIALLLAVTATQFPRSGDDWGWGSSIGTARLDSFFAGYNGRYLGNLAVLSLMHATWAIPLVAAATLCLLIWLVADLADQRDLVGVIVSAALVITMPLALWQQSVVWVSGFANYGFASVVLLGFLRSVKRDLDGDGSLGVLPGIGLLVVAILGQLFIEHVTIFIVLAACAVLAARLLRRSMRVTARSVIWVVGAVTGAAVMFSNSAYRGQTASGQQYQRFGDSSTGHSKIVAAILQGTGGVSQYAVAINVALNASLLVLIACLTVMAWQRTGRVRAAQAAAVALGTVGMATGVAVSVSVQSTHYFGLLTPWSWVGALALFVAIVLAASSLVEDRRRAAMIVLLALAVVVLIAPMAAVRPYGPRNFLPSYLMMAVIAVLLLAEIRAQQRADVIGGVAAVLGAVGLVAVLASYFVVYHQVGQAEHQRLDKIRQAVAAGRGSTRVYTLPYPTYTHVGDPLPGGWEQEYELYYGIPTSFRINLVDSYARQDIQRTDTSTQDAGAP